MTRPSIETATTSPTDFAGPRVALYTEEFSADPHRAYRDMRARYGSLVPVDLAPGVPATLVIGYRTALRILHDPAHFPADSRIWQRDIPRDCPVLPMLEWRPAAIRTSGAEHQRYRQATVDGVNGIDQFALRGVVEQVAFSLINGFCAAGTADLISQYALPLAFTMINAMLGCPQDIGQRAAAGMAAMFDGVNAAEGSAMFAGAMSDLVSLKRSHPGDDVVTRLLQHRTELDNEEMIHQVLSFYGAGIEPLQNLIANTLQLMLTDDRFGGGLLGGSLSTRDALDELLFTDPPLSNYAITFPRQPILIDDVWLPAHQPVMISLAACNNDPEINNGEYTDNRSHLAWSAGPHACPANSVAYLIAQDAIDQLLDALPELSLAVPRDELSWRPGPFHRSLTALPVVFPATPPLTLP
ncbi:cytochrome P450 [Nocardia vaccinii]|uniref:cytochrome P450 n=1 Tax=Nocardia vaccinii TaxID=1822 RepID=UPI0008295221|nr:cytochrome P450 [Nocardia vaccinii]